MIVKISTTLAAASVALVVLIDLATGQGPPLYNNYMQAQQDFRQPPPPPMHPVGYIRPGQYPPGPEMDKEYKKAIELGKGDLKEEKKHEHELAKEHKKEDKYDKYDKYNGETTPAPGVLSSFSNSMNDAWKSISSLGRSKRGAPEEAGKRNESASSESLGGRAMSGKAPSTAPGERSMDTYEYLQYKNQGYVYFKVPKYLVCNY